MLGSVPALARGPDAGVAGEKWNSENVLLPGLLLAELSLTCVIKYKLSCFYILKLDQLPEHRARSYRAEVLSYDEYCRLEISSKHGHILQNMFNEYHTEKLYKGGALTCVGTALRGPPTALETGNISFSSWASMAGDLLLQGFQS